MQSAKDFFALTILESTAFCINSFTQNLEKESRGRVEGESRKSRGRVEEESRKSRGRVEREVKYTVVLLRVSLQHIINSCLSSEHG